MKLKVELSCLREAIVNGESSKRDNKNCRKWKMLFLNANNGSIVMIFEMLKRVVE
jgi:hypothetical protein